MNKTDLVKSVASKVEGASQKDILVVLETVVDTIKESVIAGEKVNIAGFGAFERTERAARVGRNPQDGSVIEIKASKAPKFKASKSFKDAIKNNL